MSPGRKAGEKQPRALLRLHDQIRCFDLCLMSGFAILILGAARFPGRSRRLDRSDVAVDPRARRNTSVTREVKIIRCPSTGFTLLLSELCLVSILAVTRQGPGRLSGAASAIALTQLAAARVALFVVSVIFGIAFYRLRTLMVCHQQHDTCVPIVTLALLSSPPGTWFGCVRRKLLRPEVRALFPEP